MCRCETVHKLGSNNYNIINKKIVILKSILRRSSHLSLGGCGHGRVGSHGGRGIERVIVVDVHCENLRFLQRWDNHRLLLKRKKLSVTTGNYLRGMFSKVCIYCAVDIHKEIFRFVAPIM